MDPLPLRLVRTGSELHRATIPFATPEPPPRVVGNYRQAFDNMPVTPRGRPSRLVQFVGKFPTRPLIRSKLVVKLEVILTSCKYAGVRFARSQFVLRQRL